MTKRVLTILGGAVFLGTWIVAVGTIVNWKLVVKADTPNPVGAWFGIARPCPADATADSPTHAQFCQRFAEHVPIFPAVCRRKCL